MATADAAYDKDLGMFREPTIWRFDHLQFCRWLAEHGRYDAPEAELFRPLGPSSGALALPPAYDVTHSAAGCGCQSCARDEWRTERWADAMRKAGR